MSSNTHHFDIDIAKKYDINIAIFLSNIAHWVGVNAANKINYKYERYWTYNNQEAFLLLFPYWTRQTLRTTINKCLRHKLIMVKNHNDHKYKQTRWYTLTDLGISLFPKLLEILNAIGGNQPMERLKSTNGVVEINQSSITDIKPDIKPDNPHFQIPDWLDKETWERFKEHRKKKMTEYAQKLLINKLDRLRLKGFNPIELLQESIIGGWPSVYEPKRLSDKSNYTSKPITQDQKVCTSCKRPENYCQCNEPMFNRENGQQRMKSIKEMMQQKGIIAQKGV